MTVLLRSYIHLLKPWAAGAFWHPSSFLTPGQRRLMALFAYRILCDHRQYEYCFHPSSHFSSIKTVKHLPNPSPSGLKLQSIWELAPICRQIIGILLSLRASNCHPHLGTYNKLPSHCSNPSLESFKFCRPPGNSFWIAITSFESFSGGFEIAIHLGTWYKLLSHIVSYYLQLST